MTRRPLIAGLVMLWLPSLGLAAEKFSRTQLMMGDVEVSIQIVTAVKNKAKAFAAMEQAFAEGRRLEGEVSEWHPNSQTSQLNRMAGKAPVKIGQELMQILLYSLRVSAGTDGAFDITFATRNPKVSYREIRLDPKQGSAFLTRRWMKVGISGIAKGFIVDRMAAQLRKERFHDFLIAASGDIYAAGRDRGHPWSIGIKNPQQPGAPPRCQVSLKNSAISTSGTYERGPHILDPKTGRPVQTDLASATVIAPLTMESDALATALFVMGKAKGGKMLQTLSRGGGVLVDQRGGVVVVGRLDSTCGGG